MSNNASSREGFRRGTVKFRGRVQGVGFRFTTVSLAQGLPVTGFVRNDPDGAVTLVAEGREQAVKAFLGALHLSRLGSFIRDEHVAWGPATGQFTGFEIRYN